MIDIAAYIGQMVRKHELVIIPGLGGFLTHFHGASIHALSNRLQSPGRHIAFNTQLKDNDGLLAHSLAKEIHLSYKDAMHLIDVFSEFCQRELESGHQISFDKLGVLSQNSQGIISFSADLSVNYADEYFGLPDIIAPRIQRRKEYEPVILLHPEAKKKLKSQVPLFKKIAAIALPLMLLSVFGYFAKDQISNIHQQTAAIVDIQQPLKEKSVAKTEETLAVRTNNTFLEKPIESKDSSVEKKTTFTAEIVYDEAPVFAPGEYHIVCGAFSHKDLAVRLLKKLESDGFKSYIAGQNASGLYRVSLGNFTNRSKAVAQLRWYQTNHNNEAWLLKEEL